MTAKKGGGNTRSRAEGGSLKGTLLRILIWVTVLAVAVAVLWGIWHGSGLLLFTRNPFFTLNAIEVEATPNLREEGVIQILEQIGVRKGAANLFQVDPRGIRERLEREVVVARAEVSRRLPDGLAIRIYERRPAAKLKCVPRLLVDGEGRILPYWETRGDALLPTITAIREPSRLSPGEIPEDKALLGAVEFLRKISARPEGVSYDVSLVQLDYYLPSLKIHLRRRDVFRDGAVIVVPVDKMDAALDRLRDIVKLRMEAGKMTSFIDVTYEKNCPVRS